MTSTDILAFGAHPDDVEIGAGGILAKHSMAGYNTMICNLTEAELSSNGTVENRKIETKNAANILGVQKVINLKIPDRGIDDLYIDRVIGVIRRYKPKVILAPYWNDRHPDHVACHHLIKKAIFDAKIHKQRSEIGKSHCVDQVYYYFLNNTGKESFIVDITEVYEKKLSAICAYVSQFNREMGEKDTPLNQGSFLSMIQARDMLWGYQIGACFGEALVSLDPISQQWILP